MNTKGSILYRIYYISPKYVQLKAHVTDLTRVHPVSGDRYVLSVVLYYRCCELDIVHQCRRTTTSREADHLDISYMQDMSVAHMGLQAIHILQNFASPQSYEAHVGVWLLYGNIIAFSHARSRQNELMY